MQRRKKWRRRRGKRRNRHWEVRGRKHGKHRQRRQEDTREWEVTLDNTGPKIFVICLLVLVKLMADQLLICLNTKRKVEQMRNGDSCSDLLTYMVEKCEGSYWCQENCSMSRQSDYFIIWPFVRNPASVSADVGQDKGCSCIRDLSKNVKQTWFYQLPCGRNNLNWSMKYG